MPNQREFSHYHSHINLGFCRIVLDEMSIFDTFVKNRFHIIASYRTTTFYDLSRTSKQETLKITIRFDLIFFSILVIPTNIAKNNGVAYCFCYLLRFCTNDNS